MSLTHREKVVTLDVNSGNKAGREHFLYTLYSEAQNGQRVVLVIGTRISTVNRFVLCGKSVLNLDYILSVSFYKNINRWSEIKCECCQ